MIENDSIINLLKIALIYINKLLFIFRKKTKK